MLRDYRGKAAIMSFDHWLIRDFARERARHSGRADRLGRSAAPISKRISRCWRNGISFVSYEVGATAQPVRHLRARTAGDAGDQLDGARPGGGRAHLRACRPDDVRRLRPERRSSPDHEIGLQKSRRKPNLGTWRIRARRERRRTATSPSASPQASAPSPRPSGRASRERRAADRQRLQPVPLLRFPDQPGGIGLRRARAPAGRASICRLEDGEGTCSAPFPAI